MIKRTLYFGNLAYLSMKNAQMVLRMPGKDGEEEQTRTFPIEDLGVVILDNKQITITQGLMERLLENNCAVMCQCAKHHCPCATSQEHAAKRRQHLHHDNHRQAVWKHGDFQWPQPRHPKMWRTTA